MKRRAAKKHGIEHGKPIRRQTSVSRPFTFDLPASKLAKIVAYQKSHGFKSLSDVIRAALEPSNLRALPLFVADPHRQTSVRMTENDIAVLRTAKRKKRYPSVAKVLHQLLEQL